MLVLTPLAPQSRFGDKTLKFQGVCLQNGTAVLKGLTVLERLTFDNISVSYRLIMPHAISSRSLPSPRVWYYLTCNPTSNPTVHRLVWSGLFSNHLTSFDVSSRLVSHRISPRSISRLLSPHHVSSPFIRVSYLAWYRPNSFYIVTYYPQRIITINNTRYLVSFYLISSRLIP